MAEAILGELDEVGKRLVTIRIDKVPEDIIKQHYVPHDGKYFFDWLVDSLKDKPIVLAVYEGEEIVRNIREKVGPTDPVKAPKTTIRGKYSDDSLEKSKTERRVTANVIHASDSCGEAEREINVWKRYLPSHLLSPQRRSISKSF